MMPTMHIRTGPMSWRRNLTELMAWIEGCNEEKELWGKKLFDGVSFRG